LPSKLKALNPRANEIILILAVAHDGFNLERMTELRQGERQAYSKQHENERLARLSDNWRSGVRSWPPSVKRASNLRQKVSKSDRRRGSAC